jgi:hypothetical protein
MKSIGLSLQWHSHVVEYVVILMLSIVFEGLQDIKRYQISVIKSPCLAFLWLITQSLCQCESSQFSPGVCQYH